MANGITAEGKQKNQLAMRNAMGGGHSLLLVLGQPQLAEGTISSKKDKTSAVTGEGWDTWVHWNKCLLDNGEGKHLWHVLHA